MSLNVHVIECTTDPVGAPAFVGMHWVNTTSEETWLSVGTTDVNDWQKVEAATGEANTASNAGTGGVGVFDGKVGVDLEFRNIISDGNTITVALDVGNKEVNLEANLSAIDHDQLLNFVINEHLDWTQDQGANNIHDNNIVASSITQHEGSITHDNLGSIPANDHIDHTTVTLTAGEGLTGGGNIAANRSFALDFSDLSVTDTSIGDTDLISIHDGAQKKITFANFKSSLPSTGETNTMSNQGTGIGVFDEKNGVDFELRSLVAASTKISIVLDDPNDEIDLDVNEGNLTIANMSDYDANKFIDHTLVTLTAGEGLTGGGTIAANRSFALDFSDLSTSDTTIGDTDLISIHDGAQKKITFADFKTATGFGTGSGDVVGPGSSTDNAIARYDGVTGKLIQDSSVIIDDSDNMSGINDLSVNGIITQSGSHFITDAETVIVSDNHMYLNAGYTTVSAQTGGLVVNYLPTATSDTVNGAITAGVAATSNPTIVTTASATFSVGEFIQLSNMDDSENNGLYEVLSHVGTTLTIRGVGLTSVVEDFTQNQLTTNGSPTTGDITKVNISVIRAGTNGLWEYANGSSTTLSFTDFVYSGGAFHDGFSDFVANEHIDHSSVTLTAGEGLTGGGDITANRSFALDFSDLSVTDTLVGATDLVSIHDGSQKKITFANFEAAITHDNLASIPANDHIDHSLVSIATSATSGLSGGGNLTTTRNILVAPHLATAGTVASGDLVLIADIDDSNNLKKVTAQSIADLAGAGSGDITSVGSVLTGAVDYLDMAYAGVPLTVQNTTNSVSVEVARFIAPDKSPLDGDEQYLTFYHENSAGSSVLFGQINSIADDTSSISKNHKLTFEQYIDNTLTETLFIGGDAANFGSEVGSDFVHIFPFLYTTALNIDTSSSGADGARFKNGSYETNITSNISQAACLEMNDGTHSIFIGEGTEAVYISRTDGDSLNIFDGGYGIYSQTAVSGDTGGYFYDGSTIVTIADGAGAGYSGIPCAASFYDGVDDVQICNGTNTFHGYGGSLVNKNIGNVFEFHNLQSNTSVAIGSFISNNSSPLDNNEMYHSWFMENAASASKEYARFSIVSTDVTAATEDGEFSVDLLVAGSLTEVARFVAGGMTVVDDAYNATTWNGNLEVPTKNAIRDQLESLSSVTNVGDSSNTTPFDGTSTGGTFLDFYNAGGAKRISLTANDFVLNENVIVGDGSIAPTFGIDGAITDHTFTGGTGSLALSTSGSGNLFGVVDSGNAGVGAFDGVAQTNGAGLSRVYTDASNYRHAVNLKEVGASTHVELFLDESTGTVTAGIETNGGPSFSFDTNVIPDTDDSYDLGSSTLGWRGLYLSDAETTAPSTNGEIRYNNTDNRLDAYVNGELSPLQGGWHGSNTRIKIMPNDFISVGKDASAYHASGDGGWNQMENTDGIANYPIPTGFKATHVRVYASSSSTVTVYENSISDGTTATSKGTGNTTAEIDITDVSSTTTNYLSVKVETGNNEIHGGYVTIAPI